MRALSRREDPASSRLAPRRGAQDEGDAVHGGAPVGRLGVQPEGGERGARAAAVAEYAGARLAGVAHCLLPLHRIDMPSVLHCVPFLAILPPIRWTGAAGASSAAASRRNTWDPKAV